MSATPLLQAFVDDITGTISYVLYDAPGGHAAVVDPVWDFDPKAGRSDTRSIDRLIHFIRERGLNLDWILETHAHADHLSAAQLLRQRCGGKIAIGNRIGRVQAVFKQLFNLEADFRTDGSQFDHLFDDEEEFAIGQLRARALFLPGHTPADMAYQVGDAVFIGDTLFMPDVGTARCDFPGGDARTLYQSIRKLLALPDYTRLYMCHDYPPGGRDVAWVSTVAEQRRSNIHIADGIDEEHFVAMRQARDAGLDMPMLLLPAVQVNIRAGALPPPEANGLSYLKTPVNGL